MFPILGLQTSRILLAPESTGRASGRRPSGFQGWSNGKRWSVAFSGDFAAVQGGFLATQDEALAVKGSADAKDAG